MNKLFALIFLGITCSSCEGKHIHFQLGSFDCTEPVAHVKEVEFQQ